MNPDTLKYDGDLFVDWYTEEVLIYGGSSYPISSQEKVESGSPNYVDAVNQITSSSTLQHQANRYSEYITSLTWIVKQLG